MDGRIFQIMLICLLTSLCLSLQANQPESVLKIVPPVDFPQAKQLFIQAWDCERELEYENALARYKVVLEYFRKNDHGDYAVAVLNNMGTIYARLGRHKRAVDIIEEAINLSRKCDDLEEAGQLCHKLGIILTQLGQAKKRRDKLHIIAPETQGAQLGDPTSAEGTYHRIRQVGKIFRADYIEMEGSLNPFENKNKPYTKLFNLKVKSDFDPEATITPDSVELLIQIRKSGYFPIGKTSTMLAESEYAELNETMVAIPRQVKPKIREDFYRQETVPDEITLSLLSGDKAGRPTAITDKESFKPGHYRLSLKKAGYHDISREITLVPGEGPFILPIHLTSKSRDIACRIQSDFPLENTKFSPDEVSLNGQPVHKESKVKPGKYQLVLKKDGYEPISKEVTILPDERQYQINEMMHALPREVIYHLTGDYANGSLQPDDISLDSRPIRYGDSVQPESYRLVIRKEGYDIISDRVVIEPSSKPYSLKENLVSTPRRIELYVTAGFPKGKRLFPQIATLNNKSIGNDESFKPGRYKLLIEQPGFSPADKMINVTPNGDSYRIEEELSPNPREIQIKIKRDVQPAEELPSRISLVDGQTKQSREIASGDKVSPQSYTLKIKQPGYEIDISQHTIFAGEEIFKIERRLTASLRSIIPRIISEYPPKQLLIPDEITLDNQTVGQDFKARPGHHDLVILCEGYMPIRESVEILASPREFRLNREMKTRTRLAEFVFLDAYSMDFLEPDEIMLKDDKIMPGEAQNIKPGEYDLSVRLRGYASLDEVVEIPVGTGPCKIVRKMEAIQRKIILDITTEYPGEKLRLDNIDLLTLNDIPIGAMKDANSGEIMVKPGRYQITIQKTGYEDIVREDVEIYPDPAPYQIKEMLTTRPRKLEISVKSSFPFADQEDQKADSLKLGTRDIQNGDMVKPGKYAMEIKKKGHKTIYEQIAIEPSESSFQLERTLQTLPRKVEYRVVSDFDERVIEPDLIAIDDGNVDKETKIIPGRYTVRIEKLGFYSKDMELTIEPDDENFLVDAILVSMPREIELNITGDYPKNEIIEAEVATLNGDEIYDNVFKPGKYTLEIQQPGFSSLSEDLIIPPGEDMFAIQRVLISLPRIIDDKISFDVPAPEELLPHKITLAPVGNPEKESVVQKGDKVRPGEYVMRITREAYETIEKKKYIWPENGPVVIEEKMTAKQVQLLIDISYNVKPPADLADYTVSLIDRSGIPQYVKNENLIKPGMYKLNIERPGYSFGPPTQVYLIPSEHPYNINKKLLAKKRQISFDMVYMRQDSTKEMVSAYKIINVATGKNVTFKDWFDPGKKVDLIVMFEHFKTVRKKFMIEPGEGPYCAQVPMVKLGTYEFVVRYKDKKKAPRIVLDDIEYPYIFYVDSHPVEKHHLQGEPGPGKWYYTLSAEKDASYIQGYGGYMFAQKRIKGPRMFPRFNSINPRKLIEHMESIIKIPGRGYRAALEVMENGLRSSRWKRMLQQCNSEELKLLVEYLENWDVPKDQRLRLRVILETLTKMMEGE